MISHRSLLSRRDLLVASVAAVPHSLQAWNCKRFSAQALQKSRSS